MGAVIGVPIAYFLHKFISGDQGYLEVLKELIAYVYVTYLRRNSKRRCDFYDYEDIKNLEKIGMKVPKEEWRLECPRKDIDFNQNTDTIQFYGVNSRNESYFVRISKTSFNLACVWLQLRLADEKRYDLPVQREWKVPRVGEDTFAGGGLRIRCLVPMRKWRISYNGLLKEYDGPRTEIIHVKFSFIWIASSMLYDLSTDINPRMLANFLAKQSWGARWLPNVEGILKYLDSYDQIGNMLGTISVRGKEEKEVYLWGGRQRRVEIHDTNSPTTLLDLCGYMKDGESFHFGSLKFPNLNSVLKFGYVLHSNRVCFVPDDYQMSLPICNEGEVTTIQTADVLFKKGEETRKINFGAPRSVAKFVDNGNTNKVSIVQISPILFDKETGFGIITDINRPTKSIKPKSSETRVKELLKAEDLSEKLVAGIEELGCNDCHIAGGKGASLGELTAISRKDTSFTVPKGLVITTAAYEVFLKNSPVARKSIQLLEDVASGKTIGELQDTCKDVVQTISKEHLPEKIALEFKKKLEKMFTKLLTLKFAVRSSATGEDSEEMSAAGQMDTLLGIQGFEELTKAIVKCWASQFSYTAIQYKRQYGQLLNSPMAVVVQEMVPAESAGVIFTCDPLTGNPECLTLTANYGIGESVVSASADPDTIFLKRSITGKVELQEIKIGQKKNKIVIAESEGVEEKDVNAADRKNCCLSQEMALALGKIAVKIEDAYACPMDIEWAVVAEKIHLLQARPVTTFDKESDFEINHDVDSCLLSEEEYTSTANVGEVMPGAFSPLSITNMPVLWAVLGKTIMERKNPNMIFNTAYYGKMIIATQRHCLFNIKESVLRFHKKGGSLVTDANIISIFGRLLDDEELFDKAARRNSNYPDIWQSNPLVQIFHIVTNMLTIGGKLRKTIPIYKNYVMDFDDCEDSKSIHEKILRQCLGELFKGYTLHMDATTSSSLWNVMILYILRSASGSWNADVFSDFSTILSQISNVESADVPCAMQKLSNSISKFTDPLAFRAMTPEDALKWLRQSEAAGEFINFLANHGHRCVKEFDIHSKPWELNHLPLIRILQEMVGRVMTTPTAKAQTSAQKLNVQLTWTKKLLLKIFTPFTRNAVVQRENSKSLLIKVFHIARKGYLHLAEKMVEEGRLPDSDLLFFLTHEELEQLLETRSPRLVQKAIRRRVVHPKLEKLQFAEIAKGIPKPENEEDNNNFSFDSTTSVKGIPVSRGTATGPARVATSLEEAKDIQPGDILIAHSTDIGWSPYFPLLAGVSTELGGLISHGAVVAREYGLPCVVGVHGATKLFKTGDMVFLDGSKGILQKISSNQDFRENISL